MNITKKRFIAINKYVLFAAIALYLLGVFTPVQYLQPGLIFVFGAGFFCLLHIKYFAPRPKLAGHVWMIPLAILLLTYTIPLTKEPGHNHLFDALTFSFCFIPFVLFLFGKADRQPGKKQRLKLVSARTVVQTTVFMIWASVTAVALIRGTRPDMVFWAIFHVTTAALLPFLIGRGMCGWLCPNATMQDALYKHMNYRRPIPELPRSIEEQSHSCAMNISGEVDTRAPLLPFTLLLCWFPMFFLETVFHLTPLLWYQIVFMYGLIVLSLLLPWRKLCTHFCWLSSYRCLAGNNSLWRLRYNRSKCQDCKICTAEKACPFYIDIRNQDNEMPASCCLCFSCMEACPFEGVITLRRAPEEKARLKAEGKAA